MKNIDTAIIKPIFLFWILTLYLCLSPQTAVCQEEIDSSIIQGVFQQKWTGDYQQMVDKRLIRALVPFSKTYFFIDGTTPRGLTYELLKQFEQEINRQLKTRHLDVHVFVIPTPRDRLISALANGYGDIAAGNLTRTRERLKHVDFSASFLKGVSEIPVTRRNRAEMDSITDLSGSEVYVRKSSSYYESLVTLNHTLKKKGMPLVKIVEADEHLEDEDLLEMVNAELIPMIVIDRHKGEFWSHVFDNIKLHPHLPLRKGGQIAWAIRKNSPQLKAVINTFVKKSKKGTLLGNVLFERYLKKTGYVKNHLSSVYMKRFLDTAHIFQKYAGIYGFDWLALVALAYQESNLDQSKRSEAGAVGIMQMLPATARDKHINIPDLEQIDPNIHAGTKYLRFIYNRYFDDPAIDKLNRTLLTFAAYNAGPARISKLRREAKKKGLDPNIWFNNVEVIAAKRVGRETVQYVSNIFKYYIAYRITLDKKEIKKDYSTF